MFYSTMLGLSLKQSAEMDWYVLCLVKESRDVDLANTRVEYQIGTNIPSEPLWTCAVDELANANANVALPLWSSTSCC